MKWAIARVLGIGVLVACVLYGINAFLDNALSQELRRESAASAQHAQTLLRRLTQDAEQLRRARVLLDSARVVRPVVQIDTVIIQAVQPTDTLPRVLVTVDGAAYPTHVPVADALTHYKQEAALVDTVVIPRIDTILVRVDSAVVAADSAIAQGQRRPPWWHRTWTMIRSHSRSFVVGVATGAAAAVIVKK